MWDYMQMKVIYQSYKVARDFDLQWLHYVAALGLIYLSELVNSVCPDQYSGIIHCSCFIFSGQINLTSNLCTVQLFWTFDLQPWKFWPSLWKDCPNHCSETINGNCFIFSVHVNLSVLGHFDLLTFDRDIMIHAFYLPGNTNSMYLSGYF